MPSALIGAICGARGTDAIRVRLCRISRNFHPCAGLERFRDPPPGRLRSVFGNPYREIRLL